MHLSSNLGRISLLQGLGPDLGARPLFSMCIHLSVYLYVGLSVCLSVYLSVSLSVCLSVCQTIDLSFSPFTCSFLVIFGVFFSFFFSLFLLSFFFFPPTFLQGHIQRRKAPLGARLGAAAPRAPMLIRLRQYQ